MKCQCIRKLFKKALAGETQYVYTSLLRKNGSSLYIHLNIIPAISEEKVIGIFGIAKDITHLKKSAIRVSRV